MHHTTTGNIFISFCGNQKDFLILQCGQCVVIYLWKLLHVVNDELGILDIVNDTMKKLEQLFPVEMEQYKKSRHIKGSGPGGDYNGPTLKSIMANTNGKLDDIENIIAEKATGGEHRFVEHLKNLNELNKAVNQKVLDLSNVKEMNEPTKKSDNTHSKSPAEIKSRTNWAFLLSNWNLTLNICY